MFKLSRIIVFLLVLFVSFFSFVNKSFAACELSPDARAVVGVYTNEKPNENGEYPYNGNYTIKVFFIDCEPESDMQIVFRADGDENTGRLIEIKTQPLPSEVPAEAVAENGDTPLSYNELSFEPNNLGIGANPNTKSIYIFPGFGGESITIEKVLPDSITQTLFHEGDKYALILPITPPTQEELSGPYSCGDQANNQAPTCPDQSDTQRCCPSFCPAIEVTNEERGDKGWYCGYDKAAITPIPASPGPPSPPCAKYENGICVEFLSAIGPFSVKAAPFITTIMGILLSISGMIALYLIIRSGYQLMTSRGNPEAIQEARERLTAAIIGLLFIIFSLLIFQLIVVDLLKIPGIRE